MSISNSAIDTLGETKKVMDVAVGKPKVFGHAHMAKTAGTEINIMLASRYERVCGNKAASSWIGRYVRSKKGADKKYYEVDPHLLGFEDCDYVSMEIKQKRWSGILTQTGPMEMHIPCRDPIEHVLSQCNYYHNTFECSENKTKLAAEVNKCIFQMVRFPVQDTDLMTRKCFNPIPVESYIEYMGQYLQPRRNGEIPYYHVATNKARNKTAECLRTNLEAQAYVREYLIETQPYYRYCNECIGSVNDLFAQRKQDEQ